MDRVVQRTIERVFKALDLPRRSDIEALNDHLGVKDAVVVGCSVGGLIAQGLAVKRHRQFNRTAGVSAPATFEGR